MGELIVAVNGFGRIGRGITRAMHARGFEIGRLVAVADVPPASELAHLLKYDSIHGRFPGTVQATDSSIRVTGSRDIEIVPAQKSPKDLPWRRFKCESDKLVVIESTGKFTDPELAKQHLEAGADYVIISAPATGKTKPDITLVFGVNEDSLDLARHKVISLASCTTNCLAPVAKVLDDAFGIEYGTMTTVHAYTNDQPSHDQPHRDLRRARAAAANMIPTKTGAASAIGEVLPKLRGKLDGMAVRVPVLDVSLTDFTVHLATKTTAQDINRVLREASERNPQIIGYTEEPLVSTDFLGDSRSTIVDASYTMIMEGKQAKLLLWYDNETGFANRVSDAINRIAAYVMP